MTSIFEATQDDIFKLQERINLISRYKCDNCIKKFEKKEFLEAHNKKCKPKKIEREYECSLCDKGFNTIKEYNKHKLTKEHYQKIDNIEYEEIDLPDDDLNTVLDPYLDNDDREALKNSFTGEGISLNFKDNRQYNINFDTNSGKKEKITKPLDYYKEEEEQKRETVSEYKNEIKKREETEESNMTVNQKKIMEFLIKISNKPDNHKFFFKSLEGLSLDDYRNLNVLIIRNNDISVSERQKYIQVLRLFKKHLVERFEQGEDKYREMDLKTLLDYITF